MVPPPAAVEGSRPLGIDPSDTEDNDGTPRPQNKTIGVDDDDGTPRPQNKTIGHRSSTETLKIRRNSKKPSDAPIAIDTNTNTSEFNSHRHNNNRHHQEPSSSATSPTSPTRRSQAEGSTTITPSRSIANKFSLSRKKKKRLQREEEEREEQRLKEEANEAIRRKHGEYHPPGHSQGQIHTHRLPQQHDHHHIERTRSSSNMRQQYHQRSSVSSSRIASPTPRSQSRASTRSSASSFYTGSRNGSYIHPNSGNGNGYGSNYGYSNGHGRPTSPMGEIVSMPADYFHTHPHMNVLEGLDAESMLSEHWNGNSEDEDDNLSRYNNRDDRGGDEDDGRVSHDRQRKASLETSSSYKTDGSSSLVWVVPERPLSPSSVASSRNSRTRSHHHHQQLSSISHQIRPDSRLSNQPHHITLEMREMNNNNGNSDANKSNDKPNHQSWPLNNMSTTGIVTGLSPEFDGHGEDVQRPHSSMSRYQSTRAEERGERGRGSKYKDPRVERYLHHARSISPTNSNIHSSASNHRPSSRHYHHRNHQDGSDFTNINNNRKTSSEVAASSTAATAAEALRAKAGSRATNYRPHNQQRSSKTGNTDTWSVHETVVSTDEHNYLAPLPPFQQGPAYTRVPKRKFCKFFCGGCRWWVLLLLILIPAALIAVAAAFLLHWFRVCIAIDPTTVAPIIYTIDPATVQGISLDYQTRTKGIINIIDSPSLTETRIVMKLNRQFYNMKNRQDLTGFKVSTLENGFARFTMDDEANNHRDFFISSVLCSDSILTIEIPRPKTIPTTNNATQEIGLDIQLDQQDVFINLDQTLHRNANWKFRGVSNRNMVVQSLNINALSISYTSTSPSTVVLQNVIVRDQLAVMSVSGDINATVGFSAPSATSPSSSSPSAGSTTPTTVNLNTLDGQIQLDISRGWNQSSTFQIDSPDIQLSKAGAVILPFGGSHNRTDVSVNGLKAAEGQHSLTGSYKPQNGGTPPSPTASATPSSTPASSTLGAGGSAVPAQLMIQANKNVAINFP
ncbi:hypothetical protein BGZ95_010737 [Linnemannia exigua]|uniref:Uncharacterized protein n=1 Tax=Linnemannia exigua TaxID=604196 RepID=A0AAD4DAW7_9FUNG|nr:hypothetical protein BGZ95_010737 [Linnemannia exigua]